MGELPRDRDNGPHNGGALYILHPKWAFGFGRDECFVGILGISMYVGTLFFHNSKSGVAPQGAMKREFRVIRKLPRNCNWHPLASHCPHLRGWEGLPGVHAMSQETCQVMLLPRLRGRARDAHGTPRTPTFFSRRSGFSFIRRIP